MKTRSLIIGVCTGKKRYNSKSSAFTTGIIEMKIRINQKQLYTYKCPICNGFHLTHHAKSEDLTKFKII